ncbi:MAG TPA: 50S ribosomal protein L10 [bacterium]|nr:50S ribosomal protein L10 [bacterium]HOL48138.1 50S ribosomal protein L10 [bacterium]HPQ18538.1 50S ribosomal protein L10 [bacterium]
MPNRKNIEEVVKLRELVKDSKCLVLNDYRGIKSNDMNILRSRIRKTKSVIRVIRNRLMKIVLEENNTDKKIYEYLQEPTLYLISKEETIAPLKELKSYTKENELFKIRCGIIEGRFYSSAEILQIADLPEKNELLSMLARALNGPMNKLVNALAGNIRNLVNVLNAIKEKKESK